MFYFFEEGLPFGAFSSVFFRRETSLSRSPAENFSLFIVTSGPPALSLRVMFFFFEAVSHVERAEITTPKSPETMAIMLVSSGIGLEIPSAVLESYRTSSLCGN